MVVDVEFLERAELEMAGCGVAGLAEPSSRVGGCRPEGRERGGVVADAGKVGEVERVGGEVGIGRGRVRKYMAWVR